MGSSESLIIIFLKKNLATNIEIKCDCIDKIKDIPLPFFFRKPINKKKKNILMKNLEECLGNFFLKEITFKFLLLTKYFFFALCDSRLILKFFFNKKFIIFIRFSVAPPFSNEG
jgi:hypothetical protein